MTGNRKQRRTRSAVALLALVLSIQAIAWVTHAVEHTGWSAGVQAGAQLQPVASAGDRGSDAPKAPDAARAESSEGAHVHGGPFARCGACDALAQLQGGAHPWQPRVALVRAVFDDPPEPGVVIAHRILARATARGPPHG